MLPNAHAARRTLFHVYLIFDIDGTLLASNHVDDACFADAIRETLGITFTDTDWANYPCATDEGLLIEIVRRARDQAPTRQGVDAVKHRFVTLLDERISADPASCRPIPGVPELLAYLREHHAGRIGLASGAWPESARTKLRHAGLNVADLPATFSHADAQGHSVPRHQLIQKTLDCLATPSNLAPSETTYIGDGLWDLRAARALDIHFRGLATGEKRHRLIAEGVDPTHILPHFQPLEDALQTLFNKL
jgi:phosphoglycolate phosphatase-like HAD superfamily hydrolase